MTRSNVEICDSIHELCDQLDEQQQGVFYEFIDALCSGEHVRDIYTGVAIAVGRINNPNGHGRPKKYVDIARILRDHVVEIITWWTRHTNDPATKKFWNSSQGVKLTDTMFWNSPIGNEIRQISESRGVITRALQYAFDPPYAVFFNDED